VAPLGSELPGRLLGGAEVTESVTAVPGEVIAVFDDPLACGAVVVDVADWIFWISVGVVGGNQ